MLGLGGDLFGRSLFHQFTMFEDGNLIADMFNHGEVMGDEEVGEIELFLKIHQKIDDLGLDRNVEGTDRFVTDDELRFHG